MLYLAYSKYFLYLCRLKHNLSKIRFNKITLLLTSKFNYYEEIYSISFSIAL